MPTGSKSTGMNKRNSAATTKSGTRRGKPSATGRANALTRSGGKRSDKATSALNKTRKTR